MYRVKFHFRWSSFRPTTSDKGQIFLMFSTGMLSFLTGLLSNFVAEKFDDLFSFRDLDTGPNL